MPYYKGPDDRLYWLSDEDIVNGGRDLIPAECVQISDEEGRQIENPLITTEQRALQKRLGRDGAISDTDWLVIRHRDEVEIGAGTSLTADQYRSLQAYRKALRDLPTSAGWPDIDLPAPPDFVAQLLQLL
jgi:hypothetical protein